MRIVIPAYKDLALSISNDQDDHSEYPTAHLQKGLLLHYRNMNLAEEAVGFGLPVIKCGLQAVFPGKVGLVVRETAPHWIISADYLLNLVEKFAGPRSAKVKPRSLYALKNVLAALIRKSPSLRTPLTYISNSLRKAFGWVTTYEVAGNSFDLSLVYTIDPACGKLFVEAGSFRFISDAVTELILMNEQGAHYFDHYLDSSGNLLAGRQIGCWDEVTADRASFSSAIYGIAFSLSRQPGARLFRGRELVDSRLAWSGFGLSLSPTSGRFSYSLEINKLP
jgi:hypothetical protein